MKKHDWIKFRIYFSAICVIFIFFSLAVYSFILQVKNEPKLDILAQRQAEYILKINGKRGNIYDRNKNELAISIDSTSIFADPRKLRGENVKILAKILNLDIREFRRKLKNAKYFVWVKRKISEPEENKLKALKIRGVYYIDEPSRFYPNNQLASQTLGFIGNDNYGLIGIEKYYEKMLFGPVINLPALKDALGRNITINEIKEQEFKGQDIILTIDKNIQYFLEEEIANGIQNYGAKQGMGIVMDCGTGEILGEANFPTFNLNEYKKYDKEIYVNKIVSTPYEPGSIIKPFVVAKALLDQKVNLTSKIFCERGEYKINDGVVHDLKPHGNLTIKEIIKYSSNIGMSKLAKLMGPKNVYDALRLFGFGEKTGVDLPGETKGLISNWEEWEEISLANVSFGQGISTSGLQLIRGMCAFINDGYLITPKIKSNANISKTKILDNKTLKDMQDTLFATVNDPDGTAKFAKLAGYSVYGKTGTAQKFNQEKNQYELNKNNASFIGLITYSDKKIGILISLDEPVKYTQASLVAVPIFKNVALKILAYFDLAGINVAKKE
jgi:cell division protein FtsI (penicillin-binding protein 3)